MTPPPVNRRASRVLEVDGVPIRLCGASPSTPEGDAALSEVLRAALELVATLPELCRQRPAGEGFKLPCLEQAGHQLPHRDGRGRTWGAASE